MVCWLGCWTRSVEGQAEISTLLSSVLGYLWLLAKPTSQGGCVDKRGGRNHVRYPEVLGGEEGCRNLK